MAKSLVKMEIILVVARVTLLIGLLIFFFEVVQGVTAFNTPRGRLGHLLFILAFFWFIVINLWQLVEIDFTMIHKISKYVALSYMFNYAWIQYKKQAKPNSNGNDV
jgi:hypothetical protein